VKIKKPLIGLTCSFDSRSDAGTGINIVTGGESIHYVPGDYVNAVTRAGGIPVIISVYEHFEDCRELLGGLDGVLLIGGGDIDPRFYGEEKSALCGRPAPERDEQEISIARFAVENNIPLLGICRGIQVLNVALGGTLWQDLEHDGGYNSHRYTVPRNEIRHYVNLSKGSVLNKIYGTDKLGVNSFHHQAVKRAAEGTSVIAESEDGVVEAIEVNGKSFAVAVQWHPEMMYDSAEQRKLFDFFIAKCAE